MEFFNLNAEEKYKDIIHRKRPDTEESKIRHPRMPVSDRAKIFAPFSALKGYGKVIQNHQQEIFLSSRPLLAEDEQEILARRLAALKKGREITITFFQEDPDASPLGFCRTLSGRLDSVNVTDKALILKDNIIHFEDLLDICVTDEP
ncbi:MAG: hypothetical protein ACOX8H_12825 [Ruminococcus sp.]|jgi:hypothetical protein